MAINLSQLSAATTAITAISGLIMVSPQSTVGYQPQNPANSDGTASTKETPPHFLFNYEGEQSASIESDITDHYIEDNTAIQDQIALKPEIITTHGFIGELNDVLPEALQLLKTAAEKLTTVGAYVPQLSLTANIAYTEALLAYEVASTAVNSAVSAVSSIGNFLTGSDGQSVIGDNGLTPSSNQNKQQVAFQQLYGYWRTRTLFTIQTPWAVFQNMAIYKMKAVQSEETNTITDFDVTFKMIRTAQTITTGGGFPVSFSGRSSTQSSSEVDLGTSSPTESTSLGSGLSSSGVA